MISCVCSLSPMTSVSHSKLKSEAFGEVHLFGCFLVGCFSLEVSRLQPSLAADRFRVSLELRTEVLPGSFQLIGCEAKPAGVLAPTGPLLIRPPWEAGRLGKPGVSTSFNQVLSSRGKDAGRAFSDATGSVSAHPGDSEKTAWVEGTVWR